MDYFCLLLWLVYHLSTITCPLEDASLHVVHLQGHPLLSRLSLESLAYVRRPIPNWAVADHCMGGQIVSVNDNRSEHLSIQHTYKIPKQTFWMRTVPNLWGSLVTASLSLKLLMPNSLVPLKKNLYQMVSVWGSSPSVNTSAVGRHVKALQQVLAVGVNTNCPRQVTDIVLLRRPCVLHK